MFKEVNNQQNLIFLDMKQKLLFLGISCIALLSCSDDNEISNYFEYNEDGKIFVRGGKIVNANTNVDFGSMNFTRQTLYFNDSGNGNTSH